MGPDVPRCGSSAARSCGPAETSQVPVHCRPSPGCGRSLLLLSSSRRRAALRRTRPLERAAGRAGGKTDGGEAVTPWPRRKGQCTEPEAGADDAAARLDSLLMRVRRAPDCNYEKTTHSTVHVGAVGRTGRQGRGPRRSRGTDGKARADTGGSRCGRGREGGSVRRRSRPSGRSSRPGSWRLFKAPSSEAEELHEEEEELTAEDVDNNDIGPLVI